MSPEKSKIEGIKRAKVVMLGAPAVGKTSLVRQYVHSVFSETHLSTLGVKVDRRTVEVGATSVSLLLWDMHGETEGLDVPRNYLTGATSGLLVFDQGRPETFDTAHSLGARLLEASPNASVYIVANKADLAVDQSELVGALGTKPFVPTSAKTGAGVEELFDMVAKGVVERG